MIKRYADMPQDMAETKSILLQMVWQNRAGDSMQTISPYRNREMSWLKFNERVLEEAEDAGNPLMERMKFIGIFASNLDEFFMVRVGSLFAELALDKERMDKKTGLYAEEQLTMIFHEVRRLAKRLGNAYAALFKELEPYGYIPVNVSEAEPWLLEKMTEYFEAEVAPLLSPQIISPRHPFPFIHNRELYIAARLTGEEPHLGIVPVPSQLSRKIVFHSADGQYHYVVLLEDLMTRYVPQIFNDTVTECFVFRVTRNGDMDFDEGLYEEDTDWRQSVEELLKQRHKQNAVRIQFSREVQEETRNYLCQKLNLTERETMIEEAPLDLSFCFESFDGLEENPALLYKPHCALQPAFTDRNRSIIEQIARTGDILLAYPYHSMRPFLDLIEQAATHPDVVSIKITLYRVAAQSRIVNALMRAAENGKEVLVLVELRARFDEQHNIDCSKKLEEAGCTVIYGVEHFKVHTKLMVMTLRRHGKIQYITQIGTGNYNEKTAALYTDLSLITANREIGREAVEVFKHLALGQFVQHTNYLLVAPDYMKQPLSGLIDYETALAKQGKEARIILKINSLSHKELIDKLLTASQAGVKVILLVRGICCLQAGIPGISENIQIHSIVGRYLEHSRIYSFGVGERQKLYIGSADWMTRNMDCRVEAAVEILDKNVKQTLNEMLELYLQDNQKRRTMDLHGNYRKPEHGVNEPAIDSQTALFDYFADKQCSRAKLKRKPSRKTRPCKKTKRYGYVRKES